MRLVRVVGDRDSVHAGDDMWTHGWSDTVPASTPVSVLVADLVVKHLAWVEGRVRWTVLLTPGLVLRTTAEAQGVWPEALGLVGSDDERGWESGIELAMLDRYPGEPNRITLVGPDAEVGMLPRNDDGDVALVARHQSLGQL